MVRKAECFTEWYKFASTKGSLSNFCVMFDYQLLGERVQTGYQR